MKFPNSNFWNYSTQIYQLPEVADICLHLQNTCAADVNILLYCCWTGDQRIALTTDDIQALLNISSPWQSAVLKPLREARKVLKHQIIAMPAELHNKTLNNLAEMEINAEHMEQLNMEKTLDLSARTASAAAAIDVTARNLMLYAQQWQNEDGCSTAITRLLKHIYGDDEAAQIAMMSASA